MGVLRARFWTGASVPLRISGALLLVTVLGVVINAIHPVVPWALLWIPGTAGGVVLAAIFLRTARAEHLPAPIRRFWRHLSVAAVLVGLGNAAQAITVFSADDPSAAQTSAAQMVFHGGACSSSCTP